VTSTGAGEEELAALDDNTEDETIELLTLDDSTDELASIDDSTEEDAIIELLTLDDSTEEDAIIELLTLDDSTEEDAIAELEALDNAADEAIGDDETPEFAVFESIVGMDTIDLMIVDDSVEGSGGIFWLTLLE
jgi:hypothetical protein